MQQPPPPMDVQLTVETAKHGNDPVVWEMSYGSQKGGPNSYPTVTVPAKTSANFTVTINNPGNITFSNDPIWSAKDNKPTKSGLHGLKLDSGAGTTVLKFHDGNANAEKLVYVLNFSNVPPGTPAQLDPIIDNQGGGPGGFMNFRDYSNLLIGGAVLLVLVVAFVLFRRRSATSRPADVQHPTDSD